MPNQKEVVHLLVRVFPQAQRGVHLGSCRAEEILAKV
jgi:hypothetical protein